MYRGAFNVKPNNNLKASIFKNTSGPLFLFLFSQKSWHQTYVKKLPRLAVQKSSGEALQARASLWRGI